MVRSTRKLLPREAIVNVSDLIGSWGPFQKRLFTIIGLVYCVAPFNTSGLFFYSMKDDIICDTGNGTQIIFKPDKCSLSDLENCANWDYSSDRITILREWTLICERYWLRSLTLAAYTAGQAIGGILIGCLSDRLGRKFAIHLCLMIEVICEFCLVFNNDFITFIVLRLFHGIGGLGRGLCSIILMMESVDPQYRAKVMFWYDAVWHGISACMICVTYFVPSFRYIYLGTTFYQLFCLMLIGYLPESPRWQMVSGETDKAETTLKNFSSQKFSGVHFEEKFTKLKDNLNRRNKVQKLGISSMCSRCRSIQLILLLCLVWFLRAAVGSGLHNCLIDLPGNLFLNNLIISSSSVGAVLLMTLRADVYRRKVLLITFFLINSSLFAYFAFVLTQSTESIVDKIIFVTIAHFCNGSLSNLLYVYTPEVFPTSIRNQGTGLCSVASELAAIAGPFINILTSMTSLKVTFISLAVPSAIAALMVTILPETKGAEMPDTVEQFLLSDKSEDEDEI